MAALNYYLGLKRADNLNPESVQAGTATVGTAADIELRIQINDGSTATGITRGDVIVLMEILEAFILSGGSTGAGANLPAS